MSKRSGSDEDARLAALASYPVDEPDVHRELQEIAGRAVRICGTPIGGVVLLERDRIRIIGPVGIQPPPLPRETSVTEYATFQSSIFVLQNALEDPRFANAPIVIGALRIRFYASVPLITPEGHHIGVFALLDHAPRDLTATQRAELIRLGRETMDVLEKHRRRRTSELRSPSASRLPHIAAAAAAGVVLASTFVIVDAIRRNSRARWLERTRHATAATAKLLDDRIAAVEQIRAEAIRTSSAGSWPRDVHPEVAPIAFLPTASLSTARTAYVDWLTPPSRDVAEVLSVHPKLRPVTARARDEGRVAFTAPETWFAGIPPQPLLVAPVYDRLLPMDASAKDRREASIGWLLFPIDLASIAATARPYDTTIAVYDGRRSLRRRLLLHGTPADNDLSLRSERTMNALGDTWIIEAQPAPKAAARDRTLYVTSIAGILLAALAGFAAHRIATLRLLTRP